MPDPGNTVSSKPAGSRAEFFRHSGWLMVASNLAGWLALGVHFLSKRMSPSEYGLFGALAAVTICIPAMPLQMAFTH